MKSSVPSSQVDHLRGGSGRLRRRAAAMRVGAVTSGFKRLIKTGVAAGCEAAGVLGWAGREVRHSLTILCYHRVLPAELKAGYFAPDLVVTPGAFRAHLGAMRRWYEVLPLGAAVERWTRGELDERPLAAITFDDGYFDNHAWAAPALDEVGLHATFFVISGLVGGDAVPWYDSLARAVESLWARGGARRAVEPSGLLEGARADMGWAAVARAAVARAKALRPLQRREAVGRLVEAAGGLKAAIGADRMMTWTQVRGLARCGHEVGSHGRTHELLTQLDDEPLRRELVGSRADLEAALGMPVRTVCYPNGDADDRVARFAAAAGYTSGVTVERGVNPPGLDALRLRRRFIHEERLRGLVGPASRHLLRAELTGVSDRLFLRKEMVWGGKPSHPPSVAEVGRR